LLLAGLLLVAGCGDDDSGPPPCEDRDGDRHPAAACGGDDCDDTNAQVNPDFDERCDGLDNDCDLVIDEGNFQAVGPESLAEASGATEVTWGESGSGSYTGTGSTTAFRFRDGRLETAAVMPLTNPVPGYANLYHVGAPVAGCLTRASEYLVPDPTRPGGGACTLDTDCVQATCMIPPGGTAGRCPTGPDGSTVPCVSDSDCSEICASGRCVATARYAGGTSARADVQLLSNCSLSDLATAPVEALGAFAVGVTTQGCSAGVLRAGWLGSDGASLSFYGPEARSNIWLGIDVGAFPAIRGGVTPTACSGASRGAPGASRPAVAALQETREPQGLVAYLGAPFQTGNLFAPRTRCAAPTSSVPVEVLGLYKESGGPSARVADWVTGSNDGRPETLGETAGLGAPAVGSLADAGWVVAYPEATATGGTPIALHFLSRMTLPPPYTPTLSSGASAPAHVRRATPSLAPSAAFVTVPAGGRADFVALAAGGERAGVRDIGVAWMEDCSESDVEGTSTPTESVWFALVRVDPSTPAGATVSTPVRLSTSSVPGGQPAIAYGGTGTAFVAPGWTRDGTTPVASDRRGGFVVAWAGAGDDETNDAIFAVRVSESDGLPVDEEPLALPLIDGSGTLVPAGTAGFAETPGDAQGRVSFAATDARGGFAGGRFLCPPAL